MGRVGENCYQDVQKEEIGDDMVDLDNFCEISDQEIQLKVDELLNGYIGDSDWDFDMPVPVERIANNYLGYDVELTDEGLFSDPDFLGGIHFDDKLIQVNGSIEDHEGRFSFTLAHEIGHHCLHKEQFKSMATGDEIMCRDTLKKPIAERQADTFAAMLLMPTSIVSKAFKDAFGDDSEAFELTYKNKYKLGKIASQMIDTGNFNNVSITAMANRLIAMKLVKGINYQSSVLPEFTNSSIGGMLKSYIRRITRGVMRIKKFMK